MRRPEDEKKRPHWRFPAKASEVREGHRVKVRWHDGEKEYWREGVVTSLGQGIHVEVHGAGHISVRKDIAKTAIQWWYDPKVEAAYHAEIEAKRKETLSHGRPTVEEVKK